MHFLCAFFISVLISRDKTVINCINERDGLSYLLTSKPLLRLQSGLCNQSNEMSCEIYDNAKLLMQNPTERFSCCYSRASNLRQAVTKIPLCRMICMKMFWFSVITSLPPVHGAIACWDSAPFVSTSPAMIASVAV